MADEENHERLADKIVGALELAVEQEDLAIATSLGSALELALTRCAGGAGFTERRDLSEKISVSMSKLETLRKAS